ncbi:efflux RND transporter periplasmic adaptor subunit [Ferrovum myxofaciens]|uniref:efflux RND transporter periplasmic adaptor subunit n=1 Tax=Ferrovum myxofaciens TaxID=416213 RepID=UPI0023538E81|nr:efflux RND transporter periplasmic adaptor subunit [Ferrovum myxofaciens]MBU6993810.1 efflux RND transporter periplasmic adaptor subunit [Ferrovum myxofaciens]
MNPKRTILMGASVVALIALGAGAGYRFAMTRPAKMPIAEASGHSVLYWYDPMKPDQHFHKPGKSPFMDMDLVPMYGGENMMDSGVHIDSRLTQNTGVRLATVEKGRLARGLEVVGILAFNDRLVTVVQARTGGLVERVYARAPNDVIPAGAALADLRVPEWYGAQMEYLSLRQSGDPGLMGAARTRLLQLGMSESLVAQIEKSGSPQAVVTITAPQGGVLLELDLRAGMTILPGQTLARINGLNSVWLDAEVPEAQAAGLAVNQPVSATFTTWPGRVFIGQIRALLPALEQGTRTLQVRTEWSNLEGRLRPGMYAQVHLQKALGPDRLLIPSEAIIATGQRSVVIVAEEGGHFRPAEVTVGHEDGDRTEIFAGLQPGEQIVVSGQFLIDSEASLKGVLARMEKSGKPE